MKRTRSSGKHFRCALALAIVYFGMAASQGAVGQEFSSEEGIAEPTGSPAHALPSLPYVQATGSEPSVGPHLYLSDGAEFYLRAGALYPFGRGTLERRVTAGWRLEGSLVQAMWAPWSDLGCFWELGLGVSYWAGDRGRLVTSGVFRPSLFAPGQYVADMYRVRLKRIWQRYGFAAVGASWYYDVFGAPWRITARLGTRLGSARARFDRTPSPALNAAVQAAVAGGASPDGFDFDSDVNDSDVFVGLFGSVAVGTVWHDVWLGAWHLGDVTVSAEVELGHDWMDFGDFSRSDGGIGYLGTMITVGFYH